jgi:multiple sugar transport system permease protein
MITLKRSRATRSFFFLGNRQRELLTKIVSYAVLSVGAFTMLVPFFWMLSTSFKEPAGIFKMPPEWIPDPFTLENYVKIWQKTDLARGFANSMVIAVVSTVGEVFVSTLAGYSFARIRFPGRNVVFAMLLSTMMIPGVVTMIPAFTLFRYLDWIDSWKPLIVPLMFGSSFAIFLCRQFFATLPEELADAGKIDGANQFQIYWSIYLPQARPVIATLAVLGFIARWNDYLGPLIYVRSAEKYPIALMLTTLNTMYEKQWTLLMAGSVIALIPIIVLFVSLQRYFVGSIALTGIKG